MSLYAFYHVIVIIINRRFYTGTSALRDAWRAITVIRWLPNQYTSSGDFFYSKIKRQIFFWHLLHSSTSFHLETCYKILNTLRFCCIEFWHHEIPKTKQNWFHVEKPRQWGKKWFTKDCVNEHCRIQSINESSYQ